MVVILPAEIDRRSSWRDRRRGTSRHGRLQQFTLLHVVELRELEIVAHVLVMAALIFAVDFEARLVETAKKAAKAGR